MWRITTTCLALTLLPTSIALGDWADWDEATSGTPSITGVLDGVLITVTNTSNRRDPNIGINFADGANAGDAGVAGAPYLDGKERLMMNESAVGVTYTFSFDNPLLDDWFFHYTAANGPSDWTFNVPVSLVTQVNGSFDGTTLVNSGAGGPTGGGGTLRLAAGTTSFVITRVNIGGDTWHGTFSSVFTVPEPATTALLSMMGVGLATVVVLRRTRRV